MNRLAPLLVRVRPQVAPFARLRAPFSTHMGENNGTTSMEGTKHDWGPTLQLQPAMYSNAHGRTCNRCGLIQCYGKRFGSNKYPSHDKDPLVKFPTCESYEKRHEDRATIPDNR